MHGKLFLVTKKPDKIKARAQENNEDWIPPNCNYNEYACQRFDVDHCSFSCVKKDDCEPSYTEYCFPDGTCYCECTTEEPVQFGSYWSCDNTGKFIELT